MRLSIPRYFKFKLGNILSLAALLILGSVSSARCQTVLFSDQMTTGTGWTYSHSGGTFQPSAPADSTQADFGFDYSAFGIPEAPNSDPGDTATRGLRLAANIPGQNGGDALAAVYEDESFTGQYTIQVDMWMNWASTADGVGVGTTEHGGVFAGFDLAQAQSTFAPAFSGAGLRMSTDGDTTNNDYTLMKTGTRLDTFSGQYSVTDFGFGNQTGYDEEDGNTNPANGAILDFPTTFPEFDIAAATNNLNASGTQTAGAAGFQWIVVTVEVDTEASIKGDNEFLGTASFTIENAATGVKIPIGTVDNSNDGFATGEQPASMTGGLGLLWQDLFNGAPSPPQFGFGLFDNVRVFEGFLSAGGPDIDEDGDVDGADFLEIQRSDPSLIADWQSAYPVGSLSAVAAVPEPTTAIMFALGAFSLTLRRK